MFPSWCRRFARKPRGVKGRSTRLYSHRPCIEILEDRTVLSFFAAPTFSVGTTPVAEAVADFNADGKPDLVVANQGSSTVSVLLGNGDGTFQARTDYAVGTTPVAVAVGDFNGDGKLDIVAANFGSKTVSVLPGNGDGTFGPKTDITLATAPVSLAVGDWSGDGKLDLAVATEDQFTDYATILMGNGNGTFGPPVTLTTDSAPHGGGPRLERYSTIAAGDFNGDGHTDLVVVNNKDTTQLGRTLAGNFPGTVSVMLGNGDGTFKAPTNFAVGTSPTTVAVGDFNGDGRLDFAVGNSASQSVSVFTNTGGGNFAVPTTNTFGLPPLSLTVADLNGDGRSDLALSFVNSNDVIVLFGQASGALQTTATYVANGGILTTADLNGDGHPDLVEAVPPLLLLNPPPANFVSALLNNGNGTFPAPDVIANPGAVLSSQATADFNGDGIPDRALGNGQVELGLGDGNFGDATPVLSDGGGVAAVDIDGNGTQDLLVGATGSPSNVALLLNSSGWDNRTGGAVGFTVSVAPQVTAGANVAVIVTAVDAAGNPVSNFLGTVDLDNTAPGSTSLGLLKQYTFTAADAGRHTIIITGLSQAGLNTLSTYAVAMPTVAVPVTVVPAAFAGYVFATPSSVTAGTSFSFRITAVDTFGNVETGYTGTTHFAASTADTQAVLPPDYTFTAADAGAHTFSATLFRTQSILSPTTPVITATDAAAHISVSTSMNLLSLTPNSLTMVGVPNLTSAGADMNIIVAALDVYGNAAMSYAGTVHFSSSDTQASLPADYTFTSADRGAHSFFATLKTAGTQSLAVTDTANPAFFSSKSSITVVPGMPTIWIVSSMPTTTVAGAVVTFTLTAMDSYGNLATNYTGTVHFASSDSQAVLPPDSAFNPADAGSHTFSTTLKTAGSQSITFTDTAIAVLTGTRTLTVTSAAAASVSIASFPAITAGVSHTFTVTLRDAFGNIATGYTGTVAFTSSDPLANLPANYTFTAADAGAHTFTGTLKRAGTQSITVTDTAVPALTSTESGIVVGAAAVSQFAISGPTSVTKGVGFKITVTAEDAFGNVNTGYRGAVHLSSTDGTGGTQNFTFGNNDNGVHIFSYTFNALGFQTITVTDTTNSSITGSITEDVLAQSGGGGGGGGGAA
jgi:hypothetical protein